MEGMLAGKVALVTGAAAGIGRASALVFAREGARLVVSDVDERGGRETAEQIVAAGGEALFVRADVSRDDDCVALVRAAVERFGRLDCAFNNAGIEGRLASTTDCDDENWGRTLAVNLTGTWLCMRVELRQMLAQGGGAIVNMSSVAGLVGFADLPAYVASKHGVIGLTRTAALEYAKQNVRINAVCPGVIRTAMIDRVTGREPARERAFVAMEPLGRMGEPSEVGEAAAWLCSPRASFVTGHALAVDGGFVAG